MLSVTANPPGEIPAGFLFMSWRKEKTTANQRGYNSRWAKARKSYLLSNPLCVMCKQDGRLTAATVVDHITPHKGDQVLFWDKGNWQALCKLHHDSYKQRLELNGQAGGCDENGMPTDPAHHWA